MTQEKQHWGLGIANPAKRYVIAAVAAVLPYGAFAADLPVPQPASDVTVTDPITAYFLDWFNRTAAVFNDTQAVPLGFLSVGSGD
jgi:hypothetical protein